MKLKKPVVELPKVSRNVDTLHGQLFEYLLRDHPSGKSASDLLVDGMSMLWLPVVLKRKGVGEEQLHEAGLIAIGQLLQQVELIRITCGLKELPFGGVGGVVGMSQAVSPQRVPVAQPVAENASVAAVDKVVSQDNGGKIPKQEAASGKEEVDDDDEIKLPDEYVNMFE